MSALLFSVEASSCRNEPPEDLVATIVGYRELVLRDDGRHLFFDAEHLPYLVVNAEDAQALDERALRWRSKSAKPDVVFGVDALALKSDSVVARYSSGVGMPSDGSGELYIEDRRVVDTRLATLHWSSAPDPSSPHVACVKRVQGLPSTLAPRRKAIEWLRCAELAQSTGVTSEVSRRKRAAAYHLRRAGRLDLSNTVLDEAVEIDRRASHHQGLARTAYYRAWNRLDTGDIRGARNEISKGLKLSQRMGFTAESGFLFNLHIRQLREEGRHHDALRAATRAERTFARLDDRVNAAHAQNNRAWVMVHGMERGLLDPDYEAAAGLLERARQTFSDAGNTYDAAMVSANLAWLRWRQKDFGAARVILESLAVPADWIEVLRFVRVLRGELALHDHRYAESVAAFRSVVDVSRKHGVDDDLHWLARVGLGRAHMHSRQTRPGRTQIRKGLDAMFRRGSRTAVQDGRASFFGSRRLALAQASRELLAQGDLDTAFSVASALVAAPYRAFAIRSDRHQVAPEDWKKRLMNYFESRRHLAKLRGRETFVRGPDRDAWQARRERAERDVSEAFELLYASVDSSSDSRPDQERFATPAELGAALRADEAVIVEAPSAAGETLIILHRKQTRRATPSLTSIPREIRHLFFVKGRPVLSDALSQRLAKNRVSVSFLPDPSILLRPPDKDSGALVVVADPNGDLPFARREGHAVAKTIDAEIRVFGGDATREQVLHALARAQLFHFAGHGELDPNDAWQSHLRLSQGERLTVRDIVSSRFDASLVVLSGCDTGRTTLMSPYVSFGLAEAFLLAGARTVVASMEAINDRETERLISRFYATGGRRQPAAAIREVSGPDSPSFVVYGRRAQ